VEAANKDTERIARRAEREHATMAATIPNLMDKLTSLCKRRGFIYQSSEIYGGINGFWDYGPLGVLLKKNIKDAWWHDMVTTRDDVVGLDSAIIMNPKVWEASGHVEGFNDPMRDCRACKARFRADQIYVLGVRKAADGGEGQIVAYVSAVGTTAEEANAELREKAARLAKKQRFRLAEPLPDGVVLGKDEPADAIPCPVCGAVGSLTPPRLFNCMFKTYVGALEDSSSIAYVRPETAQGIFCNFKNVLDTWRVKLPFGIAQIGKAFRNEINPRNYTFRSREFEQMELEFFCHPREADEWYQYWRRQRYEWYVNIGLRSDRLRLRDHEPDELAHYARSCADVEYEFPFGCCELEGIANRTDFDLRQHQKYSGKDMTYFDDQTRERFLPYVIEPSAGVDRTALALLCEAYDEDEAPDEKGRPQPRVVLRFHPRVAPIKAAVFPLVKRDGMPEIARAIYKDLQAHYQVFYDEKAAIGRRYRRQDEQGTPFCFTIDSQTLQDGTITVRWRDTLQQERLDKSRALEYLHDKLGTRSSG